MESLTQATSADLARTKLLRASLDDSEKEQLATQSALATYPRYRAVYSAVMPLPDLQKVLTGREAYYRMTIVGDDVYAELVTPTSARAVKLATTAKQLGEEVDSLRDTISTVENGQRVTYAFDVALGQMRVFIRQLGDQFRLDHSGPLPCGGP